MTICTGCQHELNEINGLCFNNNCDCNCPQQFGWAERNDFEPDENFDEFDTIIEADKN